MTDERILLDNLHGRVVALMALCTALAASHQDASGVLQKFKADLADLNTFNSSEIDNNNYVLGIKAVYEHLEFVANESKLDLHLLASDAPSTLH